MIHEKMEKAINDQINWELFSAYLYFSMAAYFDSVNLKGFSSWMRVQTMEEEAHTKKFYDYLSSRGGRVVLSKIAAPPSEWDSPLAAFEHVLEHEQMVTGRINDLVNLAQDERDQELHLHWFNSHRARRCQHDNRSGHRPPTAPSMGWRPLHKTNPAHADRFQELRPPNREKAGVPPRPTVVCMRMGSPKGHVSASASSG